ncbi:hypothetical protein P43SY_001994 [Pythium insidiosum]|uniref:B box-type domain-containing protein n=1 Tax=Pythium insidiosum TaxID=114742 RepID=A0AAD5LIC8_PYTIN|nr:hypothetical protein P43SY_001994 [Pythium insidiosum]
MASASSLPALSPASPAASTASSMEDASAVAPLAVCEECEERPAVADCEDCGLVYCAACDKHRHRKGKLLFHQRKRLETPTPTPSPVASSASAASSCAPWSGSAAGKGIPPPEPGVDDVLQWSLEQVADWLRDHELDMFIVEFQQQQIDGASLVSAHLETYLETQSSAARGHKKKLQREIQKLRTERTERLSSASESLTPVPSPPRVPMVPPPERSSLRRMGVNLRVNTNTPVPAAAPERHFSPVTALRARATHGQANDVRGRVQRLRGSMSSVESVSDDDWSSTPRFEKQAGESTAKAPSLRIDIASSANHHQKLLSPDPQPDQHIPSTGVRDLRSIRQALGGLDLDMVKMKKQERTVEASFDFTAEGRLQTQGFEINVSDFSPFTESEGV